MERKDAYLRFENDISPINDLFSASWLMNLRHFTDIKTELIGTVEDACFQPFWQYSSQVRMTRDWLEFAVEHLSKWCKTIDIYNHHASHAKFLERMQTFEDNDGTIVAVGQGLSNTIAIIPFQAYHDDQALTGTVLEACVRSLSRYGIERSVVVVARSEIRTRTCFLKGLVQQRSYSEWCIGWKHGSSQQTCLSVQSLDYKMPFRATLMTDWETKHNSTPSTPQNRTHFCM